MSQRKEKYARNMARRMNNLEAKVEVIQIQADKQKEDFSYLETDLAVYKAAVTDREKRAARERMEAARRRREAQKNLAHQTRKARIITAVLAGVAAVICVIFTAKGLAVERASLTDTPDPDRYSGSAVVIQTAGDDVLLASGYLSLAIPMSNEYQDYMRTYCAAYGCPYPLALATAEVESGFRMDAVGAAGEIGIMQLLPGPGGAYHDELEAATGLDPRTPAGNIAGGCYKLGQYMEKYQDAGKAAMAYNMGEAGAKRAWAAGITSTDYSVEVLTAMENWETAVNAWAGV